MENSYKVGEVTYVQKPLLMSQLGPLMAWVERLPEEHTLRNLSTLKDNVDKKLMEVLKKMLYDGSLLEALSHVIIAVDVKQSVEERLDHLKNNLEVLVGFRMVTDFFTFNMKTLLESSVQLEESRVGIEGTMNSILADSSTKSEQPA